MLGSQPRHERLSLRQRKCVATNGCPHNANPNDFCLGVYVTVDDELWGIYQALHTASKGHNA